ncbi:Kem1 5 [Scheffersomyces amazonensis]|uniref:Kem1 5 n=1 Tax=Scheffersomyces amazonensis TaxID=1078765 RepID=UPI00315C857C
MGIPKFFRFISERWPLISQLIDENQIPEFDNLYLDMNSILHTCTHSNDGSISRLTDDQMYAAIFQYIEHLFEIIKPNEVFYMAIDGVAPRAKMNQQRARRFRTAYEAEENLKKAIENGEPIPKDDPFDSNAITPGTEFMAKLTDNLKYFIHKKISEDSNWAKIKIILSGHEVPGEGEHKIMEFIRSTRSQDDYNPNSRHCIYGLDADLIMLGLVSHDPHFALLREEVTFGPKRGGSNSNGSKDLNDQKFYLLHLSLLREYLELEFEDLKDQLSFEFNFERLLDDFILIMYVIGNDFLPNLPDLFINKGAFPLLIATFKQTLKQSDGYINEHGKINLRRLNIWLHFLAEFELENFEKQEVDVEWFNKKLDDISISGEKKRQRIGKLLILKDEKKLIGFIQPWLMEISNHSVEELIKLDQIGNLKTLKLPKDEVIRHLEFIKQFAIEVGILIIHSKSNDTYEAKLDIDGLSPYESSEEFQDRISEIRKTIKKYQSANLIDTEELLTTTKDIYNSRFINWKDDYYKDKLHFSINDHEEIIKLTKHYVEGLQWVLYYYYQGVPSWNWFYKYHYSPRISDISIGLEQLIEEGGDITFEKSIPFKPFEQLMAVLPARSRKLMPVVYRSLMTDEKSPIINFYPHEVDIDMNGKTASWEAVVLLDFVDEKKLIEVLKPVESKLTPEETKRNSFGNLIHFIHNPQIDYIYQSPLPGFFQNIEHDKCYEEVYNLPPIKDLKIGFIEGAKTGKELLAGFPSLSTVPFKSELKLGEVKVFQYPSKSESMILSLDNVWEDLTTFQFSQQFINKLVYSKWPFLRECKIIKVEDKENKYELINRKVGAIPLSIDELKDYKSEISNMKYLYEKTKGIILGNVDTLVYVQPVNGLIRTSKGAYVKTFAKEIEVYPLQLIVKEVTNKDERFASRQPLPIEEEFPIGSQVVFLGDFGYGSPAQIVGYKDDTFGIKISRISTISEPSIGKDRQKLEEREFKYYPSFEVGKKLRINLLLLSRITSSFMITEKNQKINIGLELKFDGKRLKVLGYTRKNGKYWEFSPLAVDLISQYQKKFPSLFQNLSKLQGRDIPKASELTNPSELEEIRKWLKEVKQDLILASLESESLTKFSFQAIEDYMINLPPLKHMNRDIKGVPKDAILNPSESYQLLADQKFDLGDRIIYVQNFGKVPILSKGTVVGFTTIGSKTSLSIIFDHSLLSGITFGGKLKTNRGLTIDSSLVLNLTNKQFVYHSKASKSRKPLSEEEKVARIRHKQLAEERAKQDQQKRDQEIKSKASHEILSLLKSNDGDTKSEQEEVRSQFSEDGIPNSQAIQRVYGQIYNNVMSKGQPVAPVHLPFPPPPPGAGPGPGPGPYGIPVVPGIPLPPQFFQHGAPVPPPPGVIPSRFPPQVQTPQQPVNVNSETRSDGNGKSRGGSNRGRGGYRGRGNSNSNNSNGHRGGRGGHRSQANKEVEAK